MIINSHKFIPKYPSNILSLSSILLNFLCYGPTTFTTVIFFKSSKFSILFVTFVFNSFSFYFLSPTTALWESLFVGCAIGILGKSFVNWILGLVFSSFWFSSSFQLFFFRFGEGLAILVLLPALSFLSEDCDLCNFISSPVYFFFLSINSLNRYSFDLFSSESECFSSSSFLLWIF